MVIMKKRGPLNIPDPTARIENLIEVSSGPLCPQDGENCYIILPSPNISQYHTKYAELKTSYENNQLDYFLSQNYGWESVLPDINRESEIYGRLTSGRYKMHFFSDSAIAIYDPQISGDINNVVYYVRHED